jgi:hypothetical protein
MTNSMTEHDKQGYGDEKEIPERPKRFQCSMTMRFREWRWYKDKVYGIEKWWGIV